MKLRHKGTDNGAQCALYFDVRVFADLLHERMKTRRLIVVISISLTNLFIVCASMLVVISLFDQICFDFTTLSVVSTELLFHAM